LASEYQNTIASATGASAKHSGDKRDAANRNTSETIATKMAASGLESRPRGSSRIAVRGFSASIPASTSRLKPIAALRALTIQTTIQPTCDQEKGCTRHASSAPVSAKGSAKTEWLKRTNER
jgi:hypothetical protein